YTRIVVPPQDPSVEHEESVRNGAPANTRILDAPTHGLPPAHGVRSLNARRGIPRWCRFHAIAEVRCAPCSSAPRPPERADGGDRAQILDQHPVDRESTLAEPVGQLVPKGSRSLRREVSCVPEDVDGPILCEVLADCTERCLRLLPEGGDVEGEDLVEA